MNKQTIALVGSTGGLGTLIVNEVLDKPDVQLRLLVRSSSRDKAAEFKKRGAEVVEGTIGPDAGSALASLCQGASTVISALTSRDRARSCASSGRVHSKTWTHASIS
jgi:uncharacterized protein YbjT (DUF2867 family)